MHWSNGQNDYESTLRIEYAWIKKKAHYAFF